MSSKRSFAGLAGCATALVLLLAACANSSSSATPGAGGGGTSPTAGGSTPSGGGYGNGGGGNGGGGNGGGTSVATVTQSNYMFTPAHLPVKSGDTITVTDSETTTPHTFTIDGQGVNVMNNAGQSQTVTLDLQPGTYTFYCQYHVSKGMKGTLIVT